MPRGVKPKGEARNENKYQKYRDDWGKGIKKAIGTHNYREAIITEAAIIEDRLLSFLYKVGAFEGKSRDKIIRTGLGDLLKLWKENARKPLEDEFFTDLYQSTVQWTQNRNRIAHGGGGSVKSLPGEEHPDPAAFEIFARTTAIEGERIVKSIMNWYSREKNFRKKEGIPLD